MTCLSHIFYAKNMQCKDNWVQIQKGNVFLIATAMEILSQTIACQRLQNMQVLRH